jgi:hypothetical protein
VRVDTVGRIVAGQDQGSFIWVKCGAHFLDPEARIGYVVNICAAKDFSGGNGPVWSTWCATLEDLERDTRVIEWLDEPPPEQFR